MAFRIETAARGRLTVFILSGRIEKEAIAELRRLFELQTDYREIVLDLRDVGVVDRDVMRFFMRCESYRASRLVSSAMNEGPTIEQRVLQGGGEPMSSDLI